MCHLSKGLFEGRGRRNRSENANLGRNSFCRLFRTKKHSQKRRFCQHMVSMEGSSPKAPRQNYAISVAPEPSSDAVGRELEQFFDTESPPVCGGCYPIITLQKSRLWGQRCCDNTKIATKFAFSLCFLMIFRRLKEQIFKFAGGNESHILSWGRSLFLYSLHTKPLWAEGAMKSMVQPQLEYSAHGSAHCISSKGYCRAGKTTEEVQ